MFRCTGGRGTKKAQATAFIQLYMSTSCELGPVPSVDGTSLYFLPFASITRFYEEYNMRFVARPFPSLPFPPSLSSPCSHTTRCQVHYKDLYGWDFDLACGRDCFKAVFESFEGLKLMRDKGSLPTCELCNNSANMLQKLSHSKHSALSRKIVVEHQRAHLKQQEIERGEFVG